MQPLVSFLSQFYFKYFYPQLMEILSLEKLGATIAESEGLNPDHSINAQ